MNNGSGFNQWQYYQMQQQAMQQKQAMQQQGYTKKKGCGCGNKQKTVQDDQQNQQGQ
ncbi:cytochrome C oxidase subunit III [Ectobacillus funiculus]|uniref:cytochrome C oxidase subunit III n=1 Tax=Ectobacillus funiculus TaxID=137993 RepID=UPI00397A510D